MKKKIKLLLAGVALVVTLSVIGGGIVPCIDPPGTGSIAPVSTTFTV